MAGEWMIITWGFYMEPSVQTQDQVGVSPARGFAIRWWAVVPILLWIVLDLWVTWPEARARASSPEFTAPYLVGHVFGGLLIPLILTVFVWFFGGRSNRAGTAAFVAVLSLFVMGDLLKVAFHPKASPE